MFLKREKPEVDYLERKKRFKEKIISLFQEFFFFFFYKFSQYFCILFILQNILSVMFILREKTLRLGGRPPSPICRPICE